MVQSRLTLGLGAAVVLFAVCCVLEEISTVLLVCCCCLQPKVDLALRALGLLVRVCHNLLLSWR